MPDRKPAAFYADVAAAYLRAIETTRAPVVTIATQFGVTVRAARGWVARARRRGMLPPGRPATRWERVAADLNIDPDDLRAAVQRHAKGGLRP